ncbi:tyrosine-type recombinase/integrase [Bosea sp. F3-2]|uniref:tyrosine-type recombinase/integrase n=1 Tax=Bosea sp. F3-2 TaxID=2599640 RepID=UPI0011ECE2E7|nr:tyrosine-type recombinase/integrase [Bosea sp. F3-2]QEL26119.1 tyrosine-type recombinase/integrase [Bosea sp. F3-2]
MVRVRLKGVASAKRKLPDGSYQTYYYAWRGGPRLQGEPGTPEFVDSYNKAVAGRSLAAAKSGTVAGLIRLYTASSDYPNAASSQKAYRTYLRLIEDRFGDMEMAALEDRRVRGVFKDWRDEMKETPRKADYAWSVLVKLLNYAKDRGDLSVNPCDRGGRLSSPDRTDNVWTDTHIEAFLTVAPFEVAIVFWAAIWTAQRQNDLLRLTRSSIKDGILRLKQSKTGARVAMPVPTPLAEGLARNPAHGLVIFNNSDGLPWTSDGFRTSFGKVCEKAGIEDLTFHDLRGTFSNRAAAAGCTPSEIASVTGHQIEGSGTLGASYLQRNLELAMTCIRRVEENEAGTILQNGLQKVQNRPSKKLGSKINIRGRKSAVSST